VMVRSPGYFDKNYYRQFRMGWWYLIFGQLMNKLCRAESGKIGFHHHGKCREHHIFLLVNSVCGVVSIWFPILFKPICSSLFKHLFYCRLFRSVLLLSQLSIFRLSWFYLLHICCIFVYSTWSFHVLYLSIRLMSSAHVFPF
jgi:membrane-associated HD superfamily phosphohydrolase